MFSPRAFGSDGRGGCVTTGAFARDDWVVHLGANSSLARDDRCITRQLAPAAINTGARVAAALATPDFGALAGAIEGLRVGGLATVGGSLADAAAGNTGTYLASQSALLASGR